MISTSRLVFVTVLLLGLVVAIVLIVFTPWAEDARITRARVEVKTLAERARTYVVHNDRQPASIDDLVEAGLVPAEKAKDPWGQPYQMEMGEEEVIVFTTHNGVKISNHK
jgi:competence protein ComGC